MGDWRLFNQDEYLNHIQLRKIIFPEFWSESYSNQNDFYQIVLSDALEHVKRTGKFHNLLQGNNVQDFWHAHCDFCTTEINTRQPGTFYCTLDYKFWICDNCFNDFKGRFDWNIK